VVVWDVDRREDIRQITTPDVVSGMAWHPTANNLALICENGQAGVWNDVIPRLPPAKDRAGASAAAASDVGDEGSIPICFLHCTAWSFFFHELCQPPGKSRGPERGCSNHSNVSRGFLHSLSYPCDQLLLIYFSSFSVYWIANGTVSVGKGIRDRKGE
jgi:hypothetical protein